MLKEMDILIMDGCTKAEAEKHLKRGTTVFKKEDFESHFDGYMNEWGVDDEEGKIEYRAMIDSKKTMKDWGVVESEKQKYYIMYVL